MLIARIAGIAKRHAKWREPTEPEIAAAVAELLEVAGDRPDLLAETAGILLGASEGRLDEPRAKAVAQLLIAAGADESLIPQWVEEGRRRAEAAQRRPFSGGVRPLGHQAVHADHGSASDPSRCPETGRITVRGGKGERDMSNGAALLILIWICSIVAGYFLGKYKGHVSAGIILTVILGPLGLLILACLPRTHAAKTASAQRLYESQPEAIRRAGYAYPPQSPHLPPDQDPYPPQSPPGGWQQPPPPGSWQPPPPAPGREPWRGPEP